MFGNNFGLLRFGLGREFAEAPTIGIDLELGILLPPGSTLKLDFYNCMAYIDGVRVTEAVDANDYPLLGQKFKGIRIDEQGISGTFKIKDGWF